MPVLSTEVVVLGGRQVLEDPKGQLGRKALAVRRAFRDRKVHLARPV
ncbi:MAG TPA: hypothetical protein VM580_35380 [Labilithrix sp.]|jgi:hypothetical protein|nr:hypothetical protein [Labilithrix sp.]